MQLANFVLIFLLSGKRHCPSCAILAESNSPLVSFKIIEYESLNNGLGKQHKNHVNNPKSRSNAVIFFICCFSKCKKSDLKSDSKLIIKKRKLI